MVTANIAPIAVTKTIPASDNPNHKMQGPHVGTL
jgi:hypothetical protein